MSGLSKVEKHTLVLLVDNEAGVLARIVGLFSGRGYNIDSLTVAEVESAAHVSLITIVTIGLPRVIELIKHQIAKMVPVHWVQDSTMDESTIEREMALVKIVSSNASSRSEAFQIGKAFHATVINITLESAVFEITGATAKVDAFIDLMRSLGLKFVSRSGVVAIRKGSEDW